MGFFERFTNLFKGTKTIKKRNALNMKVSDIVTYDGVEYEIKAKYIYSDDGYHWYSYKLVDYENKVWLSAEDDDGEIDLSVYDEIRNKTGISTGEEFPEEIQHDGETFYLEEKGTAGLKVITEHSTKNLKVRYADYESDSERYLSIEDSGDEVEVSIGKSIKSYQIEILPGKNL